MLPSAVHPAGLIARAWPTAWPSGASVLRYWDTNRPAALQGLGALVVIGFASGIWSAEGSDTWLRGYAAAVAVLILAVVGLLTLFQFRFQRRWVSYD